MLELERGPSECPSVADVVLLLDTGPELGKNNEIRKETNASYHVIQDIGIRRRLARGNIMKTSSLVWGGMTPGRSASMRHGVDGNVTKE